MKSILLAIALAACGGKAAPAPAPAPAAAPAPAPAAAPAPDLPEGVDRAMISSSVETVKPALRACGDKFPNVKGTVKVKVAVGPDGHVDVSIEKTPDPALGECVMGAMKTLSFPATKVGGSFSYPFVF